MTTYTMDDLEAEYVEAAAAASVEPDADTIERIANAGRTVGADYHAKLRRLGDRWRDVLATPAPHDQLSATRMALICALVKRNFTDGEIWETMAASAWLADLARRKGEKHAQHLIATEIAKARAIVVPFPPDDPIDFSDIRRRRNGTNGSAPHEDAEAEDADGDGEDDHEVAGLPQISSQNGDLADVADRAWDALVAANDPPRMFTHGEIPVRLRVAGEGTALEPLTLDRLRGELARSATWYADKLTNGEWKRHATHPPVPCVKDMLASANNPLPVLRRLTTAPTFARDGSLHARRGFADGIFYTGGLEVPTIPERPTPTEIAAARDLLYELLHDFPFAQPSDKAHAIGMGLQPFVRDLITGPTPLHLISAPTEGTGKGLCADALCIVALGQQAAIMTEGRDADDWRKRVTSYLLMGHQAIQLDNLGSRLDAGSLAAALTSTTWTDRILGGSTTARLPNTALWIATANNPNLSTEIARRCVRIRIDAKSAHPNRRPASEFRHPDLRRYAHEQRPALVAAYLTLAQAWIAEGRPVPAATLGSFESWAEVIGGVLQVAGVEGFLDDVDAFYEQADTDGNGWRAFVAEWWSLHETNPVSVAMLYPIYAAADFDGLDFGGTDDKARRTRLGVAIGQQRDKVYADWRITRIGTKQGAAQYRLEKVTDD